MGSSPSPLIGFLVRQLVEVIYGIQVNFSDQQFLEELLRLDEGLQPISKPELCYDLSCVSFLDDNSISSPIGDAAIRRLQLIDEHLWRQPKNKGETAMMLLFTILHRFFMSLNRGNVLLSAKNFLICRKRLSVFGLQSSNQSRDFGHSP